MKEALPRFQVAWGWLMVMTGMASVISLPPAFSPAGFWSANARWSDIGCPGGGGGVLPYVCILGMCRARDPHFQPWISVPEHIIFTNYQKNPFGSITILHFLADFAVPETIIFKISLISTLKIYVSEALARFARSRNICTYICCRYFEWMCFWDKVSEVPTKYWRK